MKKINGIKLYTKKLDKAYEVEEITKRELLANGFKIDNNSFDLAISIGGDGTFLKMIHDNDFNDNIYYAGINAGSLGFLTSFSHLEIKDLLNLLMNGFKEYEIPILKTTIKTSDEIKEYLSINEFTIRTNNFSTMHCDVLINNMLLEKYNGDGLVISTSTGSTGLSFSLGGSIIDNTIDALLLTPIAPINNQFYTYSIDKTLIFSYEKKITIIPSNNKNICFLNDGKIIYIDNVEEITCQLSSSKIKCIVPNNHSYYNVIKSKMIIDK